MASLQIGSRINVPHCKAQGVVIVRNVLTAHPLTGVKPADVVTLRYVADNGTFVDQTFPMLDVEFANPPPVDVAALALERDQLNDRVQELQRMDRLRRFAQRSARKAAKSKKRK